MIKYDSLMVLQWFEQLNRAKSDKEVKMANTQLEEFTVSWSISCLWANFQKRSNISNLWRSGRSVGT
jgi:hypothetical protein